MMRETFAGACRSARRFGLISVAALAFAATAQAGQPTGTAHVEAVDIASRTIVMLGTAYRLPADTPIVDWHGRRMDLNDLRPIPKDTIIFAESEVDAVRWQAVETRNGWVLQDVRVLENMPD